MKTRITFILLLLSTFTFAQNIISGKVLDQKGKPVAGANIYIDGTYDGATSSETGDFSFETTEVGNKTLVVSFLMFETFSKEIDVRANWEVEQPFDLSIPYTPEPKVKNKPKKDTKK